MPSVLCAHTLSKPQQRFDGCREFHQSGHFKQLDHASSEVIAVIAPIFNRKPQATLGWCPRSAAATRRVAPSRECRPHRLCRRRFDMHGAIVAEAHHLGDTAVVVAVLTGREDKNRWTWRV
jgi:hypothetical protein